jgi:hypothetical protein
VIAPANFAGRQVRAGIFSRRQFRRVFGRNVLGTSGIFQNGFTLSQMRVNQPLFWLSLTVPLPMIWMVASATL